MAVSPRAQTAPHLDGRIEANVEGGLLRGDVCVSSLRPSRRWAFDLHRGLNVREVRALDGRVLDHDYASDPVTPGDATRYVAEDSASAGGLCVAYVGAYPVYRVDEGERAASDWKGQIAFDGRTVRAAEQTRFYPVVVDSASGAALDAVTYRLDVACGDCASLYVNGSAPRPGPRATFASDVPRALLLYAGDFPFTTAGGVHFVGSEVSAADAALVQAGVRAVAGAHAAYLGVPYGEEPTFLTFAAVSRTRVLGRTSWAFVTWPTVALDGRVPFSVLVDSTGGRRALAPETAGLMGHETAHYYFGTRYSPRGPLRWFLLESTAEFLALKAVRALRGDSAYAAAVRGHFERAAGLGPVVPLDSVRAPEEVTVAYRYLLGPLLLVALERYAGEGVVQRALRGFVEEPPAGEVDYAAFRERLATAGAPDDALGRFEEECLRRPVQTGCLSGLPEVAGAPR